MTGGIDCCDAMLRLMVNSRTSFYTYLIDQQIGVISCYNTIWDISTGMTDGQEEEILEDGILAVGAGTDKCTKRFAAIAAGNVKFLLNHQEISLCIAVIVLQKTKVVPILKDSPTEVPEDLNLMIDIEANLQTMNNSISYMQSLIKFWLCFHLLPL